MSTIDAVMEVEDYITHATPDSQVLLMDVIGEFGAVNRPLLRTALYRKGIPIKMAKQIWPGHRNTKLMAKDRNRYGPKITNNVGVSQGSAISALLFTIYLDDMMEDYTSLNNNKQVSKNTHHGDVNKINT